MDTVLIVGCDPEAINILKLRLEVEEFEVKEAWGKDDTKTLLKSLAPKVALIDMISCDEEETKETSQILTLLNQNKIRSVLLLPRGSSQTKTPRLPHSDMVIKKPYELNALIEEMRKMINSPKKSSTSHRGSHPRS